MSNQHDIDFELRAQRLARKLQQQRQVTQTIGRAFRRHSERWAKRRRELEYLQPDPTASDAYKAGFVAARRACLGKLV